MRILFLTILLISSQLSFSQENEAKDVSPTDVVKAQMEIMSLREDGALVVRLLLTKKKIELYRKYGKEKLADKLKKELDRENKLMALAFSDSTFSFCPVYLIDSKDYGRVLNGEKSGYFLNRDLEVDSSIVMNEKYFLFLERGPVYDQVTLDNSFKKSETTDAAVLTDALVIKDPSMNQLVYPFPFYRKLFFAYATSLKSTVGFYLPSKNDAKGGVWYFTPPLSFSEKLALKAEKEEYKSSMEIIEQKTGLTKIELANVTENITSYYKNEYGLRKDDLTLPFNIYKMNVGLYNYYYRVIGKLEREKESN